MKAMKIVLMLMLLITTLVVPTGATIIGLNTEYGNVTNATEYTWGYHVEYTLYTDDSTFNLMCRDNMGYYVQTYGADPTPVRYFDIPWSDIMWGSTTDDCHAEIDSNQPPW